MSFFSHFPLTTGSLGLLLLINVSPDVSLRWRTSHHH
jgi:hypothetical protein